MMFSLRSRPRALEPHIHPDKVVVHLSRGKERVVFGMPEGGWVQPCGEGLVELKESSSLREKTVSVIKIKLGTRRSMPSLTSDTIAIAGTAYA